MTFRGGLDLGGTKIEAIVVDDANEILGQAKRPTPTEGGPPAIVRGARGRLREAAAAAGVEPGSLAGVGVGAPGEVDAKAGTLARAGNLNGWDGVFPLADELGRDLGVRVALGNDVRVAVEAERLLGAGRTYRSFLGVWWGTGVGGALVLDGKLWLGRGIANELGHVVVKIDGRRCPCGRRGCLEAYAGRAAMERRARKAEQIGTKTKLFEIMRSRTASVSRAASGRPRSCAATSSRRSSSRRRSTPSAPRSARSRTSSTSTRSSSAAVSARASGSRTSSSSRRRRSRISSSPTVRRRSC